MAGETLVLGYGNALRGDDGAGPRVAAAVARWRMPGVRALARHQLTPELAADLGAADRAVFVDAAPAADVPAAALAPFAPGAPPARPPSLAHAATPRELLALTAALYGRAPQAWGLRVPAERFGFGQPLSPATRRGIRQSLRAIRRLLAAEKTPDGRPVPTTRGAPAPGQSRRAAATPARRGVSCPTR